MKDTAIPSLFSQLEQNDIHLSIPSTNAKVNNQGVFYDGKTVSATNDFALQFDGSQNYVSLGTMGNLGSNLGSGFYCKFDLTTTSQALGVWGYYIGFPTTNSAIFINFNRDASNAHVVGTINVGVTDKNNLYLTGTVSGINFYDGNKHTFEIIITPAANTIVFNFDGSSQTITYSHQDTPSAFDNFTGHVLIGAANDLGSIQEFFAGTVDNLLMGTNATHIYASYSFSEGSGMTIADSSGNGNTGTLSGSPLPSWVTGASGAYIDSANYTYNQAGVTYGGLYNQNQDTLPLLDSTTAEQLSLYILSDKLQLSASQTSAILASQGYTYNEATFSYNQIGVEYGGLYNQNQDTTEMSLSFVDLYTPFVPVPGNNQSVGPGWFMFITQ